jgi:predicted PurR-regulated permease PerM
MPEMPEQDDPIQTMVRRPASGLEFLNRLHWERIVTWGVVFLVLYLLRDFFFVVFATFLFCYFGQRFAGLILKLVPQQQQTVGVMRATVVGVFLVFLVLFAGLLLAICPELFRQGRAVMLRVESTNIQAEFDKVLVRTVGSFLFRRQFGNATAVEWESAIGEYQSSGQPGLGWWEAWPAIQTSVEAIRERSSSGVAAARGSAARISEGEAFQAYTSQNNDLFPDYPAFLQWNEAYSRGKEPFASAVRATIAAAPPEVAKRLIDRDFETFTRAQLAHEWLSSDPVAGSIRQYLEESRPELISEIGQWTQQLIRTVFVIPFQSGLAFLIAFLISFDAPNILNRVRSMRDTGVRHYYDEIAPMMNNFGRLTGKAIEAQLVIGLINTVLSVFALVFLGVESIYFLAVVILFSSIVPVIGAIFAVAVVCLMATVQPDGSLTLAIQSALAITIVHAITSFIVAPRIYGNSFHLHPVLVLVILIIAEHFFGMWGLVLGVPVSVYLMQIILRRNEARATIPQAIEG